jgi:hypothetical protein
MARKIELEAISSHYGRNVFSVYVTRIVRNNVVFFSCALIRIIRMNHNYMNNSVASSLTFCKRKIIIHERAFKHQFLVSIFLRFWVVRDFKFSKFCYIQCHDLDLKFHRSIGVKSFQCAISPFFISFKSSFFPFTFLFSSLGNLREKLFHWFRLL